jgi:hypothetical protein
MQPMTRQKTTERRGSIVDRRRAAEDRRNAERVADDLMPRRDSTRRGRRSED